MLLDDALFQNGLVWIRLHISDLNAFVFHLAREVVGLALSRELLHVCACPVLIEEECVLQRGMEVCGLWNRCNLRAN